ncbi:MAG TPA: type II toxin-antitoxin system death-on-curing family toxin, partial [Myxococcales bacterium]
MPLETLSIDDVLLINQRVVDDARKSDRPIAVQRGTCVDPTIKDRRLLESAIARQHAGSNGRLYYATPELNAATLMYGLAKNHAFVDGNKRTALVAMLNHLDRNHVTLGNVSWRELEEVVLDVVMGVLPDRIRLRHAAAKSPD